MGAGVEVADEVLGELVGAGDQREGEAVGALELGVGPGEDEVLGDKTEVSATTPRRRATPTWVGGGAPVVTGTGSGSTLIWMW